MTCGTSDYSSQLKSTGQGTVCNEYTKDVVSKIDIQNFMQAYAVAYCALISYD